MNRVLGIALAVLIVFAGGWLWGGWGRSATDRALDDTQIRSQLLEARSAVLDGRLEIYVVNFGNASRHFERAKELLTAARAQMTSAGRDDAVPRVDEALKQLDEAQGLAGRLDQAANSKGASAAGIIDEVLRQSAPGS
jgi:hypothetical protein